MCCKYEQDPTVALWSVLCDHGRTVGCTNFGTGRNLGDTALLPLWYKLTYPSKNRQEPAIYECTKRHVTCIKAEHAWNMCEQSALGELRRHARTPDFVIQWTYPPKNTRRSIMESWYVQKWIVDAIKLVTDNELSVYKKNSWNWFQTKPDAIYIWTKKVL